ncbi:MAG: VTC domain-containing protein, partial [Lachnospiraceae bacterium]|nr:VTC domain-containing protein [Lachnospiraceae bacterium]
MSIPERSIHFNVEIFKAEKNTSYDAEKYRHEFKYLCTDAQLAMLEVRLMGIMQKDMHTGKNGRYQIRSLYFDDINDRCFMENEDGTAPREKYRIRIYDHDPSRISLECKRKEGDKINKKSCLLTKAQYDWLVYGKASGRIDELPELAKKLLILKMCNKMEPKVIVSYERVPY